ncbi:ABC transporter permease [Sphingomonas bacterium]|uniref:ABC transporter permease n=1 Tax=Sphingomonas bacterium TaxID=1895847 RepID=UPI00157571E2|nr:ABC transporter permease [Sphingomonas bacterium]
MIALALAYLRDRWLATMLNVLLLALAVATLVLLLDVSTQAADRFEADARGIDLVVGAKGSPLQLVLSAVYQIDAPTGNIPLASIDLLRRDPSVAMVVPLAMGDGFRGFRIVGTDPGYLPFRGARLASGRIFRASGDAVVGAEAARRSGLTIGRRFIGSHGLEHEGGPAHAQHPFTVTGILTPTGSVADRMILVSVETVWDVHGIAHPGPGAADATTIPPEVTALLVRYRSAFGALRVPLMINRQTNMQAASPAIEIARLFSLLGVGVAAIRAFAWLLAITGGLSIFVALTAAASAREADLTLLRLIGARRRMIVGAILAEGLIVAACGVATGELIGHGVLALATATVPTLADTGIDPWRLDPGELLIAALVLAIGGLAALIPAARVVHGDLARVLARTA